MKAIPVLHLPDDTTVISMFSDDSTSAVLLSLSDGRVIKCDSISMLGSLTGRRSIEAEVTDGFGFLIPATSLDIFYALHNRLIEVNSSKTELVWKQIEEVLSAVASDKIVGTFTSPVLWAGSDLGFWKYLYWEEDVPSGCETTIYVRTSATQAGILNSPWLAITSQDTDSKDLPTAGSSSSSSVTSESSQEKTRLRKSLDGLNLVGNYFQMKINLGTTVQNVSPTVYKATIAYETKHSAYFFTQKFRMESGSSSDGIIITGSYTVPQNTEIKFGVTGDNSVDWNDYTIIEPDKATSIPNGISDKFKVGIKFTSLDPSAIAVVDEFAVMLGADTQNTLNEGP